MARVFIEPHMFSSDWFADVVSELIKCKKVQFLFSNCEKGNREISDVRKALEFQQLMTRLKRAVTAKSEDVEKHVEFLKGKKEFCDCNSCDDPHIMAAIFIHPTRFVFSLDRRLAKCRSAMNVILDNRYCSFIVVGTDAVYRLHRHHILA